MTPIPLKIRTGDIPSGPPLRGSVVALLANTKLIGTEGYSLKTLGKDSGPPVNTFWGSGTGGTYSRQALAW